MPLRDEWLQTIDMTLTRMRQQVQQGYQHTALRLQSCMRALQTDAPQIRLQQLQQRVQFANQSMRQQIERRSQSGKQKFEMAQIRWQTFAPTNMLKRGYALVTDAQGQRITTRSQALAGQQAVIRFQDGCAHAIWQEEEHEKECG